MKKLLSITFIIVLIFSNSANAGRWGEGELQLTKNVADAFINYIRAKDSKSPASFYVTLDGTDGSYWYCSVGVCNDGSWLVDTKKCELQTGKECKQFAFRRTIKWKNGINTGKHKESTITNKWSDEEIYAKLSELGFYNNDFSQPSENLSSDIINQIKQLNELFESGILTKEEFTKAKKKILN